MKHAEIQQIVDQISFREYNLYVLWNERGQMYLQASYHEPDVVTGKVELQQTRKWILSEHMTKSEIVQTAFKACLTSMEHRTREHFLYKGERVYSPHYDVEALVDLCRSQRFDERPDWYAEDRQEKTNELA